MSDPTLASEVSHIGLKNMNRQCDEFLFFFKLATRHKFEYTICFNYLMCFTAESLEQ